MLFVGIGSVALFPTAPYIWSWAVPPVAALLGVLGLRVWTRNATEAVFPLAAACTLLIVTAAASQFYLFQALMVCMVLAMVLTGG
jgi:hypothetical protein